MTYSFEIFGVEAAEILSEMQKRSFKGSIEQVWSPEEMASLLQSPATSALVISQTEQPLGFIVSRQVVQETEILTICVLPEHRGRGIGSHLLQEFYRRAALDGIREIFLEVRESNDAAIILYQKNNFEIVGRRKGYYGGKGAKKQDAMVMKYSAQDQGKYR